MANKVYFWDKPTTTIVKSGEVQIGNNGFNMSFVIDGTKDSAKMIVLSYSQDEAFKPNTIVWHEDSDTWWIVANDKVERFINDNNTFVYIHNLQLEGAIELLNARDLTDCAFNQNTYTIEQIVQRLFKLSNFELLVDVNFRFNLSGNQIVDYIKTYENYTLLNALRDLFDGYNCSIKMTFTKDASFNLLNANLLVISKTGDTTLNIINGETYFKNVKEVRQLAKQSSGTTVVSNAQNVVSTSSKTFPTCGTANLTGKEATIETVNALLRLPSNIFKVNWLKLCFNRACKINITFGELDLEYTPEYVYGNYTYNKNTFYNEIEQFLQIELVGLTEEAKLETVNYLKSQMAFIFSILDKATTITLYNCDRWNPYNKNFVAPENEPDFYFPHWFRKTGAGVLYDNQLVLCPKELKDAISEPNKTYFAIGWERGKDYIENFMPISDVSGLNESYVESYESTDIRDNSYDNEVPFISHIIEYQYGLGTQRIYIDVCLTKPKDNLFKINNTSFIINYIPMTDLKVKYDNDGETNNIQLYNQNGKLTDSNAFSKILCSYKKEIESENITRYNINYNLTSHLKTGQVVKLYNESYIVNSVSLDLFQNENMTYYVVEEYTLSKDIAVKSLMTNPNTNVRDYGIPQNYNIKRKQLYRDFYELSFLKEGDSYEYLPLSKVMNVSTNPQNYNEHITVIKVNYEIDVGGDSNNSVSSKRTWYYQLNTTTYILKKSIYEVVDFKDNNIIGYSALNVSSGFDITKLLIGMTAMANTPVQYTDDNGRLKDLYIAFCTADQLQEIYENYIAENQLSIDRTLYNASVFIDSQIYEGSSNNTFVGAKDENDFLIEEVNYKKDALEVPVIEYSCQIDDSKYAIIGENILEQPSNKIYVYTFSLVVKGIYNENNIKDIDLPIITSNLGDLGEREYETTDVAQLQYNTKANGDKVLDIKLYANCSISESTFTLSDIVDLTLIDFSFYDLAVFRRTIDLENNIIDGDVDLMFIIRNMSDLVAATHITNDTIRLEINHYKIK